MAWISPKTWVTGEIVVAADMNIYFRDGMRYLKGLDGDVTFSDDIITPKIGPAAAQLHILPAVATGDTIALLAATQSLAAKTLTTPTIAATDWTNANHAHAAANSGGLIVGITTFTELFQALADPTLSTWTDSDLSAYIPAGTKAVEILMRGGEGTTGAWGGSVGCRKNASALGRLANISGNGGGTTTEYGSATMTCEVGSDRIVELYSSVAVANVAFFLIGYWT